MNENQSPAELTPLEYKEWVLNVYIPWFSSLSEAEHKAWVLKVYNPWFDGRNASTATTGSSSNPGTLPPPPPGTQP